MESFPDFFRRATDGLEPYPYQSSLATETWPEVLDVPTGLGKTAAVTLAWLYRRRVNDPTGVPRRLVWCLPMRVLVEQTETQIRNWLHNLGFLGEAGEPGKVAVHLLMGGEPELRAAHWARHPEQDAVLVGTQDMLLSRALMRGYGMSRYQWPIHFALLHHDALWVFDEVQLMGAGLPTSAQLEGLRRDFPCSAAATPALSLWVSATLRPEWLATVDYRSHVDAGLRVLALSAADHESAAVVDRLEAPKSLAPAQARLDGGKKSDVEAYIKALAAEVLAAHVASTRTLVIVNRVERAQALYRELQAAHGEPVLLHARFRPAERRALEARLASEPGRAGQILIATQAVEAGVDLTSRTLFTELAPWSSLVQRFGRCNRGREYDASDVYWIDVEGDDNDLLPYSRVDLAAARERLQKSESASPSALPSVGHGPESARVLRRRDLLDLFNTDPDLTGFDVDVSPYIRDPGSPQLQVFWRDFETEPEADAAGPARDELCTVSIGQLREHLQKTWQAWIWDPLHRSGNGREPAIRGRWRRLDSVNEARPGQTLMLRCGDGGYDPREGFVSGRKGAVEPVRMSGDPPEANDTETPTGSPRWISLNEHLKDVAGAMVDLNDALGVPPEEREDLESAAWWHDVGKAHEAFQRGIGAEPGDGPWAKSDRRDRPAYHSIDAKGKRHPRPGFRHELASALAWLAHRSTEMGQTRGDRIAYLIAAHHGRVRLGMRALPMEAEPPNSDQLFARGIWNHDRLPSVLINGRTVPETILKLDIMRLGAGPHGPSWSERTHRLLRGLGPFKLAWLEALLRIADSRASAAEEKRGAKA